MSYGTCKVCGCTDEEGCFNGCWWVNDDHDLCSNCQQKYTITLEIYEILAIDNGRYNIEPIMNEELIPICELTTENEVDAFIDGYALAKRYRPLAVDEKKLPGMTYVSFAVEVEGESGAICSIFEQVN